MLGEAKGKAAHAILPVFLLHVRYDGLQLHDCNHILINLIAHN